MSSQEPIFYDDEVDLREIILILLRYKWLILAATLLAAAVVYFVSAYFIPQQYQGVAVIAINRPEFIGINSQISSTLPTTEELALVAQSDEITSEIAGATDETGIEMVAKADGQDRIRLVVTALDAERTVELADEWAQAFIRMIRDDYAVENTITQFDATLETARQAINDAEAELTAALSENKNAFLEIRLEQAKAAWVDQSARSRENQEIIETAQWLDSKLAAGNPEASLSLNQIVALLALQQRSAGRGVLLSAADIFPTDYTIVQARADLAVLIKSALEQNLVVDEQINYLEDEIIAYRMQLDLAENEIATYALEQNLALVSYNNLKTHFIEAQVYLHLDSPVAEITSRAVVPTAPISPNLLANSVLAGAGGLIISIVGAFFVEWWRNSSMNGDQKA